MLPSLYVPLAALPLNRNGKVDRAALPAPAAHAQAPAPAAPAGSSMEAVVAAIWQHVLGKPTGLDDNFFDVGGTSLLLIAVRTGLQESLDRAIPVTWMFECTTVRSLASRLVEGVPAAPMKKLNDASVRSERRRDAFARARAMRGTAR